METPSTLTIESQPALDQSVHPLRSMGFWVPEALLVLVCVGLFSSEWTMWREGTRITGPIVYVEGGGRDADWVTVRDPATELDYTALISGDDHKLEDRATVIVHPTDPSRVSTPEDIIFGVAVLGVFLIMAIAHRFDEMAAWLDTFDEATNEFDNSKLEVVDMGGDDDEEDRAPVGGMPGYITMIS